MTSRIERDKVVPARVGGAKASEVLYMSVFFCIWFFSKSDSTPPALLSDFEGLVV